ncbi:MAG: hypothetical protein JSW10_10100 [Pseudomonadota bacterium]|nr:MAG: hypothetical protein JSW10_10100 [Pseudomonadota bacterium]
MKRFELRAGLMALAIAATAAACGGGSDGGIGGSGIDSGTGVSSGAVQDFGSVWVNDVRFDTTNAVVVVEDVDTGNGDDDVRNLLEIGQVVLIEGTINDDGTGVADRIYFDDNLEGPVEAAPVQVGGDYEFTVMGQTIRADADTRFDDFATSIADIAADDMVEISGQVDDQNRIRATYIRDTGRTFAANVSEIEIKGFVSDLDGDSFLLNGVTTVNYNAGTTLPVPFDNGMFVEAEGTSADGATLNADEVELEDEGLGQSDAEFAELEGFITEVVSANEFRMGTQTVRYDNTTVLEAGVVIAMGTKVEVEGSLEGGELLAARIESED